jgi:hypothetical protein
VTRAVIADGARGDGGGAADPRGGGSARDDARGG